MLATTIISTLLLTPTRLSMLARRYPKSPQIDLILIKYILQRLNLSPNKKQSTRVVLALQVTAILRRRRVLKTCEALLILLIQKTEVSLIRRHTWRTLTPIKVRA